MKKFTALLLCVAMLMVGVVAQAENGYVTMKAFFGDKDQLGTGTSRTVDSLSDKKLVIIFDFRSEQVGLIGYNARGKGEGTAWNTDDFSEFVAYLMTVCEEWETIEEGLDKGYSLWVLVFMDDDNKALIDSKEDADKILETLQN